MHGMLSAGILIAVFAAVAGAGLYLAIRVYRAGSRPARHQSGPLASDPLARGLVTSGPLTSGSEH